MGVTIRNIYRPPKNNNSNACVENFLNELSPIISKLCKNNNNIVIAGDMNLDLPVFLGFRYHEEKIS